MRKKIIALFGRANVGKTSTLRRVLQSLEERPGATVDRQIDRVDIRAIILIDGLKIGIETQGDPTGRLAESLELFAREGCNVIICATRTSGRTMDAVKRHEGVFRIKWIKKTNPDQECAAEILNNVFKSESD